MLCRFWSESKLFAKVISRQIVLSHIRTNALSVLIWIPTVCKFKVISRQIVYIHVRTHALSVLIWIPTVCKGYQQTNGFDTHQDQCSAGSDLNPNCLQRLSADKWLWATSGPMLCRFWSGSKLFANLRLSEVKWFRSTSGHMLCQFWSGSKLFAKFISRQMVSIHIMSLRTNALSVLIWIQTVHKGDQQTTK